MINSGQMCCIWCGYILPLNGSYEIDFDDPEEEYPICPECGEDNMGGYPSFVPANLWTEDQMEHILSLNE